ncbi:hypothetical protein A9K66_09595 [Mesorhizobium sp. AA23]|nr:hypothetical protein A9K66_09595 [Mesorhizobium sp. AA23]
MSTKTVQRFWEDDMHETKDLKPGRHLPPDGRSCKRAGMTTRTRSVASSRPGFARETVRALASTLLLLGLIGDRRVR